MEDKEKTLLKKLYKIAKVLREAAEIQI